MEQKIEKRDGADWFFLVTVSAHVLLSIIVYYTPFTKFFPWNMATNGLLSGCVTWVPAVIYLGISQKKLGTTCRFRKIRPATIFMTLLYALLCSPLSTLANAISMLFVDNTVVSMSSDVVDMPFIVMFFVIAVYAPFVEEWGFRGIIYQEYRRRGNVWKAILLSGFLFGIMHMNFNQAAYAFVIGIMLALLMEATDSIWSTFIMHMSINSTSTIMMYLLNSFSPESMDAAVVEAAAGSQEILMLISVYLVLAVVCTPLALCVLAWIAGHENRREAFAAILPERKSSHSKLITIPLIIGIVICFVMMIINQM